MKRGRKASLKTYIFLVTICIALIPLLICGTVAIPMLVRQSEKQLRQQAEQQGKALSDGLTGLCGQLEQVAAELSAMEEVQRAFREEKAGQELYRMLYPRLEGLHAYARLDFLTADGKPFASGEGTLMTGHYSPSWGILRKAGGQQGIVFELDAVSGMLYAAACIREEGRECGYLLFTVSRWQMDTLFREIYGGNSGISLYSPYFHLIYSSRPSDQQKQDAAFLREQLLTGKTATDGNSLYHVSREERTGGYLVVETPRVFTGEMIEVFYQTGAVMILISLMLCLAGAWVLSRSVSRPVQELSAAMEQVEHGYFNVRLDLHREDELGKLAGHFNRMTEEYRMFLGRSVRRQKELNEARLRMMQAQLNPHFLYNTLDTMKWLGVTNGVPQISSLATDLATMLRISISGKEFVTLEEELEILDRYLDIQSVRFEDRFVCEIDISDEFQRCIVPKMVLQPLVENALLHGIADREDGYIKLWAEKRGEVLEIFVSDNGRGMPPELAEKLNGSGEEFPSGRLGLFNINSILRIHFGEAYGIHVRSEQGKGCCVSIRLPFRQEKETERMEESL